MGYKSFEILVDNPTGSYSAGSTVSGNVVLVLDKPKKVKGLVIKFEGLGKVCWPEYDDKRYAEEEYFSHKYFLFGSENSEKEIPTGKTVYPFSTTLPNDLPTSFEGGHGHVRYSIRAILNRPWKKDEEAKTFITVTTPVDLNLLPQAKEPHLKEASITFCCLCCKTGPLTLACFIPYRGFVPGQTIIVTVDVENASDICVSSVKCKLLKEVKWIVTNPKHHERVNKLDLMQFTLGEVLPHSSKSWSQNIEIPLMPVINLDACSIIKIDFYIEVSAEPTGGHKSLELRFPIILGTVPLSKSRGTDSPTLTEKMDSIELKTLNG